MAEFLKPPTFAVSSENPSQTLKDYKQESKLYLTAGNKDGSPGNQKVALLLYSMGKDYIKVFNNFTYAEEGEKDDLDVIFHKFDEYFEPKKLVKLYVTKFQCRQQQTGGTTAEFITALRELAKNCEFGDLEERQIAIQISNGVKDEALRRKLWDDDLTLDEVIKKCHIHEQRNENKPLYMDDGKDVNAIRGRGRRPPQKDQRDQPRGNKPPSSSNPGSRGHKHENTRGLINCGNCGNTHQANNCPAKFKTCNFCQNKGHFYSLQKTNEL